jgi:hypothetical protein
MTNSSDKKFDNNPEQVNVSPWRCWLGSSMAGGLGLAAYFIMSAIANTFANKPLPTTNMTALNIAVAVRTLVVGIAALATGVFSLIAIGLFALGIQIFLRKINQSSI